MEIFFLILFLVPVLLTLTLTILSHNLKPSIDNHKNLPPGSLGWPILGENLDFLFGNQENFISHRMKKYSPEVFKTRILGEKIAVICGPNGHKFLFQNEQKLFTAFRPRSMQKLFRSYQSSSPGPVNITREAEAQVLKSPGFLKREALVKYLGEMDSITQQHMKVFWENKQEEEVRVFPFAKALTLSLACRFFLGNGDSGLVTRLVKNFDDMTLGIHSIPLSLPGTVFAKASRAAENVRKELGKIIKERKKAMVSQGPTQDILSHMIVITDPRSGKFMSEAEISDKIMGLLVAGYSNVATVMTFFMKYVGQRHEIYDKILAEQMKVSNSKKPGEFLEWDDVQKMKYSWNVIYEVMRLSPPLQGTFREVLADFTYAGYTIPRGWKVYWSMSTTNKNPDYFPNPEDFNPSRFDAGNNLPLFAFVPFGGGPRMCPGKEYARLAILTFVHNVVKRFTWEIVLPNERITGAMMPSPQKGLPIRLRPRRV